MPKNFKLFSLKKKKNYFSFIILILFFCFLIVSQFTNQLNISNIIDPPKDEIKLINCIDGDTANFTAIGKTRFLIIDTPESTNKIEPYGQAASQYTCALLTNAETITYEYDGTHKDKYGRSLAYIFVDGQLIQKKIAEEGYVKKFYLYKAHYKYQDEIQNAINDKYGLWKNNH